MADQDNYMPQEPKEKVIQGNAKMEKPKISKKVIDFLFSDKIDSVFNYLTYYILGPSLKDLIFKMGTGALQMALFGGQGGGNMPPMGGYMNQYSTARRDPNYYSNMSNPSYAQPQPGIYQQRVSLNDISFDTRDDVLLVLDRMNRELQRYGRVRVADFYTFAGITGQEGNWTLQGNGWYSLNDAHPIMRTDGRWIADMPPVQPLH